MARPLNLLDLPFELLHQVLSLLSYLDLANCQLVNSDLNSVIRNSLRLQYNIALALAQAEDNPCSVASITQKLQDIKTSEAAWSSFQPKFIVSLPVKHRTSGIYDLSGGTYLLGNADKKVLQYLRLPTKLDDPLDWYKVCVALDKTIIDMGFCVFEHDLIAIITTSPRPIGPSMREEHDIEMFLFEYSTGKPHPKAKSSRIFIMTSEFPKPSLMCEIVGENLVLILNFSHPHEAADRILIWDWCENILKASFSAPCNTYSGLLFLAEDLILLPNSISATFDIFRIPSIPIAQSLKSAFSLNLPSLAQGVEIDRITCRAEPNPIPDISRLDKKRRAQERDNAGMDETDPFAPKRGFLASAEDAICIFQMRFTGDPVVIIQGGVNVHFEMGRSYTFFIHRRSFLDLVQRYERICNIQVDGVAPDHEQNPGPIVPWAAWGPPVTRWFDADTTPTRWITTSAGQRCAMIHEVGGSLETPITIIDFNPHIIRKIKAKLQSATEAKERLSRHRKLVEDADGLLQTEVGLSDNGYGVMNDASLGVDLESPTFRERQAELEEVLSGHNDVQMDDLPDTQPSQFYGSFMAGDTDDEISDGVSWMTDENGHLSEHESQDEIDDELDNSAQPTSNVDNARAVYTTDSSDPRHPGRVRYRVLDTPLSRRSLHSPTTFAEEVEGHLPYVVYTSERYYRYDGVLLDEERIIGVKTDATDHISEVDIMYFG